MLPATMDAPLLLGRRKMTDDLVKELRWYNSNSDASKKMHRAADRIEQLEKNEENWQRMYREAVIQKEMIFRHQYDRIEQLEAALREIAAGYETGWSTSTMGNMLDVAEILSERINIARKALEGKDDPAS